MAPLALLFDLDGTLVDSAAGIAAALSMLRGERGGGPIDAAAVRPLVSLGAEVLVRRGLGGCARDEAGDLAAFRAILARLPADPACIFPGVVDTLAALAAAGHRMAVVTNKPEALSRQLLAALDLARFFDAIVGGDTLAVCKPDPAPLLLAMQRMDAAPAASLFVGDSMVDARAAAAASLPFLLFDGGYGGVDPQAVPVAGRFRHHDQLAGLVRLLAPGGSAACAANVFC